MRVTINARGSDCKNDLAQIMKLVIALVFVAVIALLNATQNPPRKVAEIHVSETASAQAAELEPEPEQTKQDAPAPTVKPFDAKDSTTWPKCAEDEIVRADNGQCAKAATPKPAPVATARAAAPSAVGSGSCATEIAKYDWAQSTALAVARAESGLNPGIVNNSPATGDYSVGCFQINLYGANARNRPSEAALKNAATNVQFAYGIYKSNGSSFIGQWGVCRSKVSCY